MSFITFNNLLRFEQGIKDVLIQKFGNIASIIGSATLNTTSQDLKGAINENVASIGNVSNTVDVQRTDINNQSRYTQATAVENDDYAYYKCTLSSMSTSHYRSIKIFFPAGYQPLKSARLSINGGVNYYPICWYDNSEATLPGCALESRCVDLYWYPVVGGFIARHFQLGPVSATPVTGYTSTTTTVTRIGDRVYFGGKISCDSGNVAAKNPVMTIPDWAIPSYEKHLTVPGAGNSICNILVKQNGQVQIPQNPTISTGFLYTEVSYGMFL